MAAGGVPGGNETVGRMQRRERLGVQRLCHASGTLGVSWMRMGKTEAFDLATMRPTPGAKGRREPLGLAMAPSGKTPMAA